MRRRAAPAAVPPRADALRERSGRRLAFLVSAALIAVTLCVYVPVRHHDFLNFDDPQYVSQNPMVSAGLTGRGARWAFTTGHAGNWHPLTWLSHMLDVQLYGLDAGRHHVTSLILHLANTVLLLALLRRMTGALFHSAFVAGLFALHPLHVESVAWVAERKDVLSTLFFMLTLWAYHAYVRQPGWVRYVVALAVFGLGLMAKPMLVTLPFVLLLLDVWPLDRASSPSARRRVLAEKLPFLGLALLSSLVTLAVQQRAGAVKALDALPLGRRLANAVVAYVMYIGKMLWPFDLAAIYPYPSSFPAWSVASAVVVLAAVSVTAIRAARRWPYLPVGWFWYLVTLIPVIGLVQVGSPPIADRYTYVPLIGVFIVVAWGAPDLLARWRHGGRALGAAAAVVMVACAIVARHQVQHWRSSVDLWEHAVGVTSGNHRAETNLGHALAKQGRSGEAVPHFLEALRIKPDFAEAHNDVGVVLADQGRVDEAIAHYREAVRALPGYAEAQNNLGVALSGQGRNDEAIGHLRQALRIEPARAESRNNLGVALAKEGSFEEAIQHLSEALRLAPDYEDARTNLAVAHNGIGAARYDQGKIGEAIRHYSEAVRLAPRLAAAHANLAAALAAEGRPDESSQEFLEALALEPGDADLHHDLAVILVRSGRTAEAIHHLETALRLDPAHRPARRALDVLSKPSRDRAGVR